MWFRLVELEVHMSKNDPYYTSFYTVAGEYYKVRDACISMCLEDK